MLHGLLVMIAACNIQSSVQFLIESAMVPLLTDDELRAGCLLKKNGYYRFGR